MLWRKKTGQLAWETTVDKIAAVLEFAVRGCLVAEKSEPLLHKRPGWGRKELFYTEGDHGQRGSPDTLGLHDFMFSTTQPIECITGINNQVCMVKDEPVIIGGMIGCKQNTVHGS